eukprot:768393-Hanusia_phi.AAC.4
MLQGDPSSPVLSPLYSISRLSLPFSSFLPADLEDILRVKATVDSVEGVMEEICRRTERVARLPGQSGPKGLFRSALYHVGSAGLARSDATASFHVRGREVLRLLPRPSTRYGSCPQHYQCRVFQKSLRQSERS